jgi:hypothetical protein
MTCTYYLQDLVIQKCYEVQLGLRIKIGIVIVRQLLLSIVNTKFNRNP